MVSGPPSPPSPSLLNQADSEEDNEYYYGLPFGTPRYGSLQTCHIGLAALAVDSCPAAKPPIGLLVAETNLAYIVMWDSPGVKHPGTGQP
jgi:hypothetical protein